ALPPLPGRPDAPPEAAALPALAALAPSAGLPPWAGFAALPAALAFLGLPVSPARRFSGIQAGSLPALAVFFFFGAFVMAPWYTRGPERQPHRVAFSAAHH